MGYFLYGKSDLLQNWGYWFWLLKGSLPLAMFLLFWCWMVGRVSVSVSSPVLLYSQWTQPDPCGCRALNLVFFFPLCYYSHLSLVMAQAARLAREQIRKLNWVKICRNLEELNWIEEQGKIENLSFSVHLLSPTFLGSKSAFAGGLLSHSL